MGADPLLDTLWRTSWQAGVLAAGVALTLRLFPRIPAAARVAVWWIVCARFVIGLAWTNPVALPLLPPAAERTVASIELTGIPPPPVSNIAMDRETVADAGEWTRSWPALLVTTWLAALFVQGLLSIRQWRHARRLVSRAYDVSGEPQRRFADLCGRVGVTPVPALRESPDITTPQATGVVRPSVLMPAGAMATWPASELSMTLAHELVHIRRNDLMYGWIPSTAVRLFFFHPLARHAAQEYLLAREAACDAQTVAALGVAPAAYGEMLVRFGVTGAPAGAVGAASSTLRFLQRRLVMLQDPQTHASRLRWQWIATAIVIAIVAVPFQLTTRNVSASATPQPIAEIVDAAEAAPQQPQSPATGAQTSRDRIDVARRDLERAEATGQLVEHEILKWSEYVRKSQDTMRMLAAETGGIRALDAAQLQKQLAEAAAQIQAVELPDSRTLAEMAAAARAIDTPELRRQLAEMEAQIHAFDTPEAREQRRSLENARLNAAMREMLKSIGEEYRAALERDSQQRQLGIEERQQRLEDLKKRELQAATDVNTQAIAERNRAERQLREARARLAQIQEQLNQRSQAASEVKPPVKIKHVDPIYPAAARERSISGPVALRLDVGQDGAVQEANIVSGAHALLIQAARDALRQWRFGPMLVRGEATPFSCNVLVVFQLAGQPSTEPSEMRSLMQITFLGQPADLGESLVVTAR